MKLLWATYAWEGCCLVQSRTILEKWFSCFLFAMVCFVLAKPAFPHLGRVQSQAHQLLTHFSSYILGHIATQLPLLLMGTFFLFLKKKAWHTIIPLFPPFHLYHY